MIGRLTQRERDDLLHKMLLLELEEKVKQAMDGKADWGIWAVMRCAELRKIGDDARPYLRFKRLDDGVIEYEMCVRACVSTGLWRHDR